MFDEYRNRIALQHGSYAGDTMRQQSEFIAEQLWMNSVSTYPVCVHFIDGGLPPEYTHIDEFQNVLYAHLEAKSVYKAGAEEPAYYLTFKPNDMRERDDIKIGSYVSIPNVHGKLEYWFIIHIDNDNEFPKCQILKCNRIVRWVHQGIIHSCLGALRGGADSEGIETVGQLSSVDSDIYFWAPTSATVQTIGYDTRFLISSEGRIPPLAWKVSRINDINPVGLTRLCLSQDLYNDSVDNIDLMIADYKSSEIRPVLPDGDKPVQTQDIVVSYNGTKPAVRVGSKKIFTAEQSDNNVKWSVYDGADTYITGYEDTEVAYDDYTLITTNHTLTLKVSQNYDLVGNVITVTAEGADGSTGSIQVEVIS